MAKIDLNEQAKEILQIAERYGVESNFFFLTMFKRYQVQIGILNDLATKIKSSKRTLTNRFSTPHKSELQQKKRQVKPAF